MKITLHIVCICCFFDSIRIMKTATKIKDIETRIWPGGLKLYTPPENLLTISSFFSKYTYIPTENSISDIGICKKYCGSILMI